MERLMMWKRQLLSRVMECAVVLRAVSSAICDFLRMSSLDSIRSYAEYRRVIFFDRRSHRRQRCGVILGAMK
eukprot:14006069-Heterocapsa_arctica.AAC.1